MTLNLLPTEKGLVTRYTHVKYEGPMANVIVFAEKQTDRRTDRQTDRHMAKKLYAPNLLMGGGGGAIKILSLCTMADFNCLPHNHYVSFIATVLDKVEVCPTTICPALTFDLP